MGPDNSGMSALLNLIDGLDQPTSGGIFLDGNLSLRKSAF
jgi:ABC-type lipoprotein export system ATPase subunit